MRKNIQKSSKKPVKEYLLAGAFVALVITIPLFIAANSNKQSLPADAAGEIIFFDDFNGTTIDTTKWTLGLHQWGSNNQGVVPENLSLRTITDEGQSITVLDTQANGDLYTGSIKGILKTSNSYPLGDPRNYTRQATGTRVGGLVWTNQRFGGGRYEIRMKTLPLSGGCSCIWNYWEPGGADYTEIDFEMPANGHANDANWSNWAGLNTYYPSPDNATYKNTDLGFPQTDGKFHVYRWDWYDGINGPKKVEWYVDGVLKASTTQNVPSSAAQLWVGNWPAPWSGNFQYDTQHLYIDWVKVTKLGGTITPTNTPIPPTNTPIIPADAIFPSVLITAPANNTTIRKGTVVTISASASDNVRVQKVEFYVNNSLKCTDATAPYSCNWNPSKRGTQYIKAIAYDTAGNRTTSNQITLYVN